MTNIEAENKNIWDGASMTQDELMKHDQVLVLDTNDNVIGSASKYAAHEFNTSQPRGMLHRAFSVFLFDENGKMLLQKRASTKITFPNVWTNTCCSHPLHNMNPSEVDTPTDVKSGKVFGVKNAAIRKLNHELGIPIGQIPVEKFEFLTRFHYWAVDAVSHGPESPWGEHEIDYVLLAQVSRDSLALNPHPEEIDEVKWVSQSELKDLLNEKNLLWSPWFRIIVKRWMEKWWTDLPKTLGTQEYRDFDTIHRFDPPSEFMGGKGKAGPLFDNCYIKYEHNKCQIKVNS